MSDSVIQAERVQRLNEADADASKPYVLYWMQKSGRTRYNHALEYAVERANRLGKPLVVGFGLMDDYPEANERHYAFLLKGLRDVAASLEEREIPFVVKHGHPADVALNLGRDAAVIVCDRDYLRHTRQWRDRVADGAGCEVVQVESELVVPLETVSDKEEYAARTIRPKIHGLLDRFLIPLVEVKLQTPSMGVRVRSDLPDVHVSDPAAALKVLKLDRSVAPVPMFEGGQVEAEAIFGRFLDVWLDDYADNRNQPQTDHVSHMSKYLHFGQVSPLWLALEICDSGGPVEDVDTYLEELLIRRPLTHNYCYFNPYYDAFKGLPDWARKTLNAHAGDRREHIYSIDELEAADTHDPYWNAAMLEMRETGYMHNHMRMYWGKKILEWSESPEAAYEAALTLNNKLFIDGRDANSFANVAWVFGQHDRAWQERPVYGKVRYMNANGLKRKAKPEEYVEKVRQMVREGETEGPAGG